MKAQVLVSLLIPLVQSKPDFENFPVFFDPRNAPKSPIAPIPHNSWDQNGNFPEYTPPPFHGQPPFEGQPPMEGPPFHGQPPLKRPPFQGPPPLEGPPLHGSPKPHNSWDQYKNFPEYQPHPIKGSPSAKDTHIRYKSENHPGYNKPGTIAPPKFPDNDEYHSGNKKDKVGGYKNQKQTYDYKSLHFPIFPLSLPSLSKLIPFLKPRKCPNLSQCKHIKGLGDEPTFENIAPAGSICVYDHYLTSSCTLSVAGSFCFLQGQYFGPERVFSDQDGNTFIKDC